MVSVSYRDTEVELSVRLRLGWYTVDAAWQSENSTALTVWLCGVCALYSVFSHPSICPSACVSPLLTVFALSSLSLSLSLSLPPSLSLYLDRLQVSSLDWNCTPLAITSITAIVLFELRISTSLSLKPDKEGSRENKSLHQKKEANRIRSLLSSALWMRFQCQRDFEVSIDIHTRKNIFSSVNSIAIIQNFKNFETVQILKI